MNDLLKIYSDNLKNNKLTRNTIEAYTRDVKRFIEFIEYKNESIKTVDCITIMAYSEYLRKEGRANSSIARSIVSIRNYYKYLIKNDFAEHDPTAYFSIAKIKRNIPQILSIEEIDELLNQPEESTIKGCRDKAMLELMYATGIKVSELLSLTTYDINLELLYIRCNNGKKNERIIPIGTQAVRCLSQYLKTRSIINLNNLSLLFLNIKGDKMTRQGYWKIIKEYAKKTNIKKAINSYTIRHSFAVHLLQNGAGIASVQELLGHNSMSTTQIYSTIVKKSKIAEIYKNTHPRA
ncbi:tyrosine recombinase [Clostridium sp. CM028]|uniref:tyrosine recombinase n=1 Tax=unclassified Clostridium TaxID=2614128 RepID=UPI001C0B9E0E|nr:MULTISPECIES: tyrosine recombinase [unclassified Clostridium]MBU3091568.1 tyrosine recombinase [Clostridium sp. CF011]MBW9144167.1 tyrosine recombinase [Clostridium sp. CM027]MBW9147522.1 tyrosine recombinase [Clostridium sp. CM028]UVE41190.1 tyrosine recombinase [Clostridium sp. CM027]WAG70186.1 tyrosine recombinase [Clostridium sp. CF011]